MHATTRGPGVGDAGGLVVTDPGETADAVGSDPDEVARLDAAGLRALAHPLRSRLIGALRLDGPSTASALAQRLGTNSGATSYHLRQLAEVGLVEEDPELGDGRSRYWRSAHRATSWEELEFANDPDSRASADWLTRASLRQQVRWSEDWLDVREDWPVAWRAATDSSDFRLALTPAQLEAYVAEVHAVVARYQELSSPENPEAEQVLVIHRAFPAPRPSL
jgi:DNA-binding transcriptional ArsR family regulator